MPMNTSQKRLSIWRSTPRSSHLRQWQAAGRDTHRLAPSLRTSTAESHHRECGISNGVGSTASPEAPASCIFQ